MSRRSTQWKVTCVLTVLRSATIGVLCALLACSPESTTGNTSTVTLTWEAPSTREDLTPLLPEEIQLYNVYVDGVVYDYVSGTEAVTQRVKRGCKSYTVTATDSDGLESKHSNVVQVCKHKGKPRK